MARAGQIQTSGKGRKGAARGQVQRKGQQLALCHEEKTEKRNRNNTETYCPVKGRN